MLYAELTEEGERLRDRMLHVPIELAQNVKLSQEEAHTLYRLLYKALSGLHETE